MAIIEKKNNIISQQVIKENNLKTLFSLIYDYGEMSRARLAEITELSPTTISSLVEELIQGGLVNTKGVSDSNSIGRKPIMLEINKDALYFAAFNWGTKKLRFYLFDLMCNVVDEEVIGIDNPSDGVGVIYETINEHVHKKIDHKKLYAICLSIPAIIEESTKTIGSTVLGLKEDREFLVNLSKAFDRIPVIIGNESIFSAYAEKEFGKEKKAKDLVYLNINEGVGAGIVLDGRLFKGSRGMAGEFGHISIDLNGKACMCGNQGCLERYISVPAILEAYRDKNGSAPVDSIDELRALIEARDENAVSVIGETAKYLAYGLVDVINLLNINHIVIGGAITGLGPVFMDAIHRHTDSLGIRRMIEECEIKYSQLTGPVSCMGAVKCCIDNIMCLSIDVEKKVHIY